jgi:hypothetical protein
MLPIPTGNHFYQGMLGTHRADKLKRFVQLDYKTPILVGS